MSFLPEPLPWVLPPLGGALLGFAFGYVAAGLFGRPSAIQRLAAGRALRRAAAGFLPRLSSSFMEKPLADFLPAASGALSFGIEKAVVSFIHAITISPFFLHEIRHRVSGLVSALCARPVSEALGKINLHGFLVDKLLPTLSQGDSRASIAKAVSRLVAERRGAPVSPALLDGLSELLAQVLPVVMERLIDWMESADMRSVIAARGRELLPRVLEKLNLMQRFLLSAGQFDRRIDEKMPEIVEETLQALERIMRDPLQQRGMRDSILLAVRDWHADGSSSQGAAAQAGIIVDRLLKGLDEPSTREKVFHSLEELLAGNAQTVGGFLRQKAGIDDREVSDFLTDAILSWLSRPETAQSGSKALAEGIAGFLQSNAATSLGAMLGIDGDRKKKIDSFLLETTLQAAGQKARDAAGPRLFRAAPLAGIFGSIIGLGVGLFMDVLLLLGLA